LHKKQVFTTDHYLLTVDWVSAFLHCIKPLIHWQTLDFRIIPQAHETFPHTVPENGILLYHALSSNK